MRFLVRLNAKELEDFNRKFLISFFLAYDTIQVYEMKNRNSDIWEEKLLEIIIYKNVEINNKQFTTSDGINIKKALTKLGIFILLIVLTLIPRKNNSSSSSLKI